ncbi:hypothetical protein COO60DRAFT_434969 [Scenedesmus sp. NREL 46B-D3]|nr:hypothetical protein COO60DRAFT_434969 [Scenedesmus sp. NREL 46B-D3]
MIHAEVLKRLQAEGWNLKPEPAETLAQELQEGDEQGITSSSSSSSSSRPSFAELQSALLDCDLRKFGAGCLPDDVNRAASSSIKGPLVLQVMSVADISKPSYATPGAGRLLLLRLHDGRTACKALEHRHCSQLSDSLTPGSKVVLDAAAVRCGVVLLEPRSIRVLGAGWTLWLKHGRRRRSMAAPTVLAWQQRQAQQQGQGQGQQHPARQRAHAWLQAQRHRQPSSQTTEPQHPGSSSSSPERTAEGRPSSSSSSSSSWLRLP